MTSHIIKFSLVALFGALATSCSCTSTTSEKKGDTSSEVQSTTRAISQKCFSARVADRNYPSIFMAWYNIDMPEYPLTTDAERIAACAKHDLMWEEPLSQLGEGVELVFGLIWDHEYHGLADSFTPQSLERAQRNKQSMIDINPNMVSLFEIRWRDAPMSFLPENSEWWKRDAEGNIVKGWLGGWEPFYMLNYENEEFQDNVARQAKIAIESGVYDGIMLDWSGHLEIIKKIRAAIGNDPLIIVNIHDDIEDGKLYADYINGSFMELNPIDDKSLPVEELVLHSKDDVNKRNWSNIEKALIWFEENLQEPRINCLEVWGNRRDVRRMRATTAMSLTLSDGYALYADPNPLATPDHQHDWYAMWDVELGNPKAKATLTPEGYWSREYDGGVVIYNPESNSAAKVSFDTPHTRYTTGEKSKTFTIENIDGDIFIPIQ